MQIVQMDNFGNYLSICLVWMIQRNGRCSKLESVESWFTSIITSSLSHSFVNQANIFEPLL